MISIFIGITSVYAEITGIILKKNELTLGIGYSETLKYDLPSDLNSSNIIWRSSNEKVATVNSNGKVTAVAYGQAIITASINGYTSTCIIDVNSNYVPVSGVNLNKSNLNITIGSSENLVSTISPNNATNKDVTYTVTDGNVSFDFAGFVINQLITHTILHQILCNI